MVYDYIIAGSGPAGSTAAFCLQKQGAKCLILEAAQKKEEKICGGFLTWSGVNLLEQIGLTPSVLLEQGSVKINALMIHKNNQTIFHQYYCGEYGIGTSRKLFDSWLLNCAVSEGAEIRYGSKVKEFHTKNGLIHVCKNQCKAFILAAGSRGFTDSSMYSIIQQQSIGISAHIEGKTNLDHHCIHFWFPGQSNNYFWAIPIRENCWNIGIWFPHIEPKMMRKFQYYEAWYIHPLFESYTYKISPRGAFCGNVDLSVNLPENCYGIGDFAGCNVSDSGEGLRYAIESAIIFAEKHRKK